LPASEVVPATSRPPPVPPLVPRLMTYAPSCEGR
jgi:hypothetical protein